MTSNSLHSLAQILSGDRFIGFENFAKTLDQLEGVFSPSYPPYDMYYDDNGKVYLDFALAGFSRDMINVEVNNGVLVVSAEKSSEKDLEGFKFRHRGIKYADFKHSFRLSDYVEVEEAEFKDGLLRVVLNKIVPEDKKPLQIKVK